MPTCGDSRPDISAISGTEGLIVARDGTIYYTQSGQVGRLAPGGTPEDFVSIAGAGTVWGLALDAANETLFVGVPGTGVYRIDLTAGSPSAELFVTGGGPNGLTIGPDGFLYYSDFSAGEVMRVDPDGDGTATMVTATPISQANGVAFDSDGTLLVCSYATGVLHRLTLSDGVETARAEAATGLGSPDGIALDADGRFYVTDNGAGRLLRLEPDGSDMMILTPGISAAASLDFGSGDLSCSDIYVASSGTLVRYEMGTTNGADVPWH
jgi:sugar lactone lactonase YvrE